VRRITGELLWVAFGQGAAAAGALLGVCLLANLMAPAGYGVLVLGMTVASLAQQILFGPLCLASQRFYGAAVEGHDTPAYLRAAGRMFWQRVQVLLGCGVAASAALWAFGLSQWAALAAAALVYSVAAGANSLLDSIQAAARNRKLVAWHQAAAQWLRFLLAAGLMVLCGPAAVVAAVGYVVASCLVLTSQWLFFRRTVLASRSSEANRAAAANAPSNSRGRNWQVQMQAYARPFSLWASFSWALASSDRWSLQVFAASSTVGQYALVYQLGYYPMMLLTDLFQQFLAPILFGLVGSGEDAQRNRAAAHWNRRLLLGTCLSTALATALAFVLHRPLFRLLSGAQYHDVSWLLPWMVLAGGLFACGQVAALAVVSGLEPQRLLVGKITTAILGIALFVAGAYRLGLVGVIAAHAAISIVYFGWMYRLAHACGLTEPSDATCSIRKQLS
jgi:O-antigen/teichoic acid export membrane protein